MSDASVEVLLDDFENKDRWDVADAKAGQTHITTFAEGAPSKSPGIYADGAAGADHRALALLVRAAADEQDIELVARPGRSCTVPGELTTLNLWVRSPHASIRVFARVGGDAQDDRELLLGKVTANGEWQRLHHDVTDPIPGAEVRGLRITLMDVIKREGEVMILLDDLTARTHR